MPESFVYPDGSLTTDEGAMHPFDIGTIAGRQTRMVPNYYMHPQVDGSSPDHYLINTFAQNGPTLEQIWFRPDSKTTGWDYRLKVWRGLHIRKHNLLLSVDWTSPRKLEIKQGETQQH
jgi:hypothetical protein